MSHHTPPPSPLHRTAAPQLVAAPAHPLLAGFRASRTAYSIRAIISCAPKVYGHIFETRAALH